MTIEKYNIIKESITSCPKYLLLKNYLHHGKTSIYDHNIAVSDASYKIAKKLRLKLDYNSMLRGALLHDYFFYDWHNKNKDVSLHGFKHPKISLDNASHEYKLSAKEKDIIRNHMFPLTLLHFPKSKESIIVCIIDKYIASKEFFKKFIKKAYVK